MTFYIGTCRYMDYELWDEFFPGRLHTTKEIIHFLKNIKNIKNILEDTPADQIDLIFGDILHPMVNPLFKHFLNVKDFYLYKNIYIEISSRKYFLYNNIPLNYHYSTVAIEKWKKEMIPFNITSYKTFKRRQNFIDSIVYKEIDDQDLYNDIIIISQLVKEVFSSDASINIITQINLKLKNTNDYIPERNSLVLSLENICNQLSITCHSPGKFIENKHSNVFMHDYVMDNQHFNSMIKYHEVIKMFNHTRPASVDIKKLSLSNQQHNRI